ncbi:hypothetical protein B4086_5611 [Bacillus cereus]|nr:hypothetical protein B4086_5611 [Bacillus cereus]
MKVQIKDMVLSQFVEGRSYVITRRNEEEIDTVHNGVIEKIDDTILQMQVTEANDKEVRGTTWIHWREIVEFEEVK